MSITAFETEIQAVLGADVNVRDTGIIQRFSTNGKPGDRAGWLVFFDTAGAFGDWRTGEQFTWSDRRGDMSPGERRALHRKVQVAKQVAHQERVRRQQDARAQAARIWSGCGTPTDHPYLDRKRIQAHGIRQHGRFLIIPLVDETGGLWSLQSIAPDGTKRFMPGGRVQGRFHIIEGGKHIGICEGYATGATLHEQTGNTVFVAFNAGNVKSVDVTARAMYPAAHLTVWGDNDQFTNGNPGVTKAREAATSSCADDIQIPDFTGFDLTTRPTDWNDYYRLKDAG